TANLGRGFGLDFPRVLVGGPAAEVDVDDRFVAAGRALPGFRAEDVGQGERGGAEGESADLEEVPPRHAVAVAALWTGDGQHGGNAPVREVGSTDYPALRPLASRSISQLCRFLSS